MKNQKTKFDFITIGGACEDLSLWTDEGVVFKDGGSKLKEKLLGFEYGAKVKVKKFLSTPGGGADNAAVALARLGFKAALLAALGGDERGKKIIRNLRQEGVDTSFIEVIKNEASGFSAGLVGRDSEHVFFPVRGANEKLKISGKDARRLKSAKWIYLTSLSGNWQPELKKIFSIRGPKIAWNPGGAQLAAGKRVFGKYLKQTDFLMLNLSEARGLVASDRTLARRKNFLNNVRNLARTIRSWGAKRVVITLGRDGALAFDGKKFYSQAAVKPKKYVNTIGVGDAFGSTFVAGLELFDGNIRPALKLAARNSSAVVEKYGAQAGLLTKKQLL